MFCTHCGVANPDTAKYCQVCGKPTTAAAKVAPASILESPLATPGSSQPRVPRSRVVWWDFLLIGFGLFWTFNAVVIAQHTTVYQGISDPELLGRCFFNVLAAAGIAYSVAGRKRVRNWHRFCRWCFWLLMLLPLVPLISARGRAG